MADALRHRARNDMIIGATACVSTDDHVAPGRLGQPERNKIEREPRIVGNTVRFRGD
jgi:hypothetical protein